MRWSRWPGWHSTAARSRRYGGNGRTSGSPSTGWHSAPHAAAQAWPGVSWRGLVGAPRLPVASGQRMIVVLHAPSVAQRLAHARYATEGQERAWTTQALAVLSNGWVWLGVALLVAHLGLYMLALRGADLSFAMPLTAASYPIAALMARFLLREDVDASRWMGTLLITLGVAVVAFGEADTASPAPK